MNPSLAVLLSTFSRCWHVLDSTFHPCSANAAAPGQRCGTSQRRQRRKHGLCSMLTCGPSTRPRCLLRHFLRYNLRPIGSQQPCRLRWRPACRSPWLAAAHCSRIGCNRALKQRESHRQHDRCSPAGDGLSSFALQPPRLPQRPPAAVEHRHRALSSCMRGWRACWRRQAVRWRHVPHHSAAGLWRSSQQQKGMSCSQASVCNGYMHSCRSRFPAGLSAMPKAVLSSVPTSPPAAAAALQLTGPTCCASPTSPSRRATPLGGAAWRTGSCCTAPCRRCCSATCWRVGGKFFGTCVV